MSAVVEALAALEAELADREGHLRGLAILGRVCDDEEARGFIAARASRLTRRLDLERAARDALAALLAAPAEFSIDVPADVLARIAAARDEATAIFETGLALLSGRVDA